MKKTAFLLIIILFTGSMGTLDAQKNRTLSHGFSVNLIVGVPSPNYGFGPNDNVNEASQIGFITGIQIGSRWYFGSSDRFKMGIMVNWMDITAGARQDGDLTRAVADVSFLEVGPIGTIALSDDIALDAYYNLRPTGFAHIWSLDSEDPGGYAGAGISHTIGTAFRWKVLNVGLEYVIGNIDCQDINSDFADEKLVNSNFRLMVGVKF